MKLSNLSQAIQKNPINLKLALFVIVYSFFSISIISIGGCSSSKRFISAEEEKKVNVDGNSADNTNKDFIGFSDVAVNEIRVLLNEFKSSNQFLIESPVELYSDNSRIAVINKGNRIAVDSYENTISIKVQDKTLTSSRFIISSLENDNMIKVDGKRYRGKIVLSSTYGNINLINQISLEDYLKGVITKEMPLGKNLEHYEALKAFAICARTYAYTKIFEGKTRYDILPDTRDQVYGGVDAETEYSNRIVDETRNLILTYLNRPAIIFYHSTCGGVTEDAANVFTRADVPYLKSVKDGSTANCIISPRYEWSENIPGYRVIERLNKSGYITGKNFIIKQINVNSRFNSGRINELEIVLNDGSRDQKVKLYGNNIRSIIRTADGTSILRSNFFDIRLSSDKTIIINGRGNGHGVGMCQWGAIGLSRNGTNFEHILNHYYPGTIIQSIK